MSQTQSPTMITYGSEHSVTDVSIFNNSLMPAATAAVKSQPEQIKVAENTKSIELIKPVKKREMVKSNKGRTVGEEHKTILIQPSTVTLPVVSSGTKTDDHNSGAAVASNPKKSELPQEQKSPEKEAVPAAISVFTLNNVIKNSDSTYYFTDKRMSMKNVTVNVISITPYKDKDILKFTIENGQMEYFFVANISIYEQKNNLSAEIFSKPLVEPGKTMDCIALIPRVSRSQLSLIIIESSGKNRTFTVKFITT